MVFNSNSDIKEFAKTLIESLEGINEITLKEELIAWTETFFTTSSEFLGELKLILKKVEELEALDSNVREEVKECIKVIDEAFANANKSDWWSFLSSGWK